MEFLSFVAGDDFRACLENDYLEMDSALNHRCWKTVHVLAGSIIEAMLVDYLVSSGISVGKDPLKMELAEVINVCATARVLSEKARNLCDVVRYYRNLVHAGRLVRLKESVDENSARIAHSLVGLIAQELATYQSAHYGYTANQLVGKIERDPYATTVVEHLLRETKPQEIERLLVKVLPDRCFSLTSTHEEASEELVHALSTVFQSAFSLASEDTKRAAMLHYLQVLKQEAWIKVHSYENVLLHATFLDYLPTESLPMVVDHLFTRMTRTLDAKVLRIITNGFSKYLNRNQVVHFVQMVIKCLAASGDSKTESLARKVLLQCGENLSLEQCDWFIEEVQDWVDIVKNTGRTDLLNFLQLEVCLHLRLHQNHRLREQFTLKAGSAETAP